MPEPVTPEPETPDRYRSIDARFQTPIDPDAAVDVTAFLTVDTVDDDNEVVLPSGGDLSRFEKNGPLLLCHDWVKEVSYYPLPVGQVVWTKVRPHGILGGIKFARGSEMGREAKALVEEEILRGVSIGFKTVEASPMTKAEAATRPDWQAAFERTRGKVNVVRKWKLLELSLTPLPCNEDTLIQVLKVKGLARPKWLPPAETKEAAVDEKTETKAEIPEIEPIEGEGPPAPQGVFTPVGDTAKALPAPDDDDDDADEGPVRNGHFVKCVKGPHKGMAGKVKSVHRAGMVPDVEDDCYGSKADPGCRVCVYKPMGEGHKETDHHVGVKASHLERTDDLKPPKRKKGIDPLTLPPLTGRTDEAVAAAQLRTLTEGVTKQLRMQQEKAMGAV
jgi:phage head maturation protease